VELTKAKWIDGADLHTVDEMEFPAGTLTARQAVYRADLHKELAGLALAPAEKGQGNTKIYLRSKVKHVDVASPSVELESGEIFTGDLIVGADGFHSIVRKVTVNDGVPAGKGDMSFWTIVPEEKFRSDPISAGLEEKILNGDNVHVVLANGQCMIVSFPIRESKAKLFSIHWKEQLEGTRDIATQREVLNKLLASYHPDVRHYINQGFEEEPFNAWILKDRDPIKSYVYGKAVLIGDAAHPMLPKRGAGANTAIEDAGALWSLLRNLPEKSDIPGRLQLFDKVRLNRTRYLQVSSSDNRIGEDSAELLARANIYLEGPIIEGEKEAERRIRDFK
jgi:salicylate hydroxylase